MVKHSQKGYFWRHKAPKGMVSLKIKYSMKTMKEQCQYCIVYVKAKVGRKSNFNIQYDEYAQDFKDVLNYFQ